MSSYLTVDRFKVLSLLPAKWVDDVELKSPGFTLAHLEIKTDWINARLRKRYAVPFKEPVPGLVQFWLVRMVTLEVDLKRGVQPTDEQFQLVREQAKDAAAEVFEAANSETGLFDLPMLDDGTDTGISQGSPRAYSEQSPYVWQDAQGRTGHGEDRSRGGTGT
jgi:hypothetical protein